MYTYRLVLFVIHIFTPTHTAEAHQPSQSGSMMSIVHQLVIHVYDLVRGVLVGRFTTVHTLKTSLLSAVRIVAK